VVYYDVKEFLEYLKQEYAKIPQDWEHLLTPAMAAKLAAYRESYALMFGGDSRAYFVHAYAVNYVDYIQEIAVAKSDASKLAEVYAKIEIESYPFRLEPE
jgi:imidazoleglycerol phosphate synthase glutamine amidotransferase subunit HisH